jgi:hypothetical protein
MRRRGLRSASGVNIRIAMEGYNMKGSQQAFRSETNAFTTTKRQRGNGSFEHTKENLARPLQHVKDEY